MSRVIKVHKLFWGTRNRTMKGMIARVWAFIFVCGLLLTMLPGALFAQEDIVESDEVVSATPTEQQEQQEEEEEGEEEGEITVQQGPFAVAPLVITEKGQPRDILKQSITLTNNTGQKVEVYADVQNFDASAGSQKANFTSGEHVAGSLANWIEITRGVIELEPFETIQIPYLVQINLRAKPGTYYAQLVFARAKRGRNDSFVDPSHEIRVMMTVEVQDDAQERLQLGMFLPDKAVFAGNNASFTFGLENVGNRTLIPRGEIRIYNRRGQEVATLPANTESETISPSGKQQLAAAWNADGRFGKYKAFLDLEYGQAGAVQDTIYFWVFPWKEVLIGFFLLLVLIVSVTYLIHLRVTYAGAVAPVPIQVDDGMYEPQQQSYSSQTHVAVARAVQPSASVQQVASASEPTVLGTKSKGGSSVALSGHAVSLKKPQNSVEQAGHVISLGKK